LTVSLLCSGAGEVAGIAKAFLLYRFQVVLLSCCQSVRDSLVSVAVTLSSMALQPNRFSRRHLLQVLTREFKQENKTFSASFVIIV
jgi:hypothetical protein